MFITTPAVYDPILSKLPSYIGKIKFAFMCRTSQSLFEFILEIMVKLLIPCVVVGGRWCVVCSFWVSFWNRAPCRTGTEGRQGSVIMGKPGCGGHLKLPGVAALFGSFENISFLAGWRGASGACFG